MLALLTLTWLTLPATGAERAAESQQQALAASEAQRSEAEQVDLERGVSAYVALAVANSPSLQAAWSRWAASVHGISQGRALPDPSLSFSAYLRAIETRSGPQIGRVSLSQSFPWPSALGAGTERAAAEARAAQAQFDAEALALEAQVHLAYWTLWELRATRHAHEAHLLTLQGVAETLQGHLEVGHATLAELAQVELKVSRMRDMIAALGAEELAAEAQLIAITGDRSLESAPTTRGPLAPQLPTEGRDGLRDMALQHPSLVEALAGVEASEASVQGAKAQRLPGFSVGVDWVLIGPATHADAHNSGQDALAASVGLSLPIWQGRYAQQISAAEAQADARRGELRAAEDAALAALDGALARVEDTARRVAFIEHTLLPQAEAVHESLQGGYAAGRAGLAQLLMAEDDLHELHIAHQQARAEHARAWAQLQWICGAPLASRPAPGEAP